MKKMFIGFGIGTLLALSIAAFAITNYIPSLTEKARIGINAGVVYDGLEELKIMEINKEKSKFEFEGFSVAKSHIASFDEWTGKIYYNGNEIRGIEGSIKSGSVNTGISLLDKHLKSDDFFDVELYPEINFVGVVENDMLRGNLLFRGITQEISFPIIIENEIIKANFLLDTAPFAMKYAGVNKEVRIAFEFSA